MRAIVGIVDIVDIDFYVIKTPPLFISHPSVPPRSDYGALKMNSCCCAACRDLGFFAFDLIRELVHDLARLVNGGRLPAWCDEKKLIARVDEDERFYAGQFQAHLSEASSAAEH